MKEEMDMMKIADSNSCNVTNIKEIPWEERSPHNSSIREMIHQINVIYNENFGRSNKSSAKFYFNLFESFLENMGIQISEFILAYIETDEELTKDYDLAYGYVRLKEGKLNKNLLYEDLEAIFTPLRLHNKELYDLILHNYLTINVSTSLLKGEEYNTEKARYILESKAYNKLFRRIKTTFKHIVLNRQKSLNSCSIAIEKSEKMAYHYRKEFELYSSIGDNKEISL